MPTKKSLESYNRFALKRVLIKLYSLCLPGHYSKPIRTSFVKIGLGATVEHTNSTQTDKTASVVLVSP